MKEKRLITMIWITLFVLLAGCTGAAGGGVTPEATHTFPPAVTQKVAATETLDPTSTPEALPEPLSGSIVFYSDRNGNPDIYLMNADGTGLVQLTDDPAYDDSPALSPDGSRIAFLTARHDPDPHFPNLIYEIYIMDSDGSNLRRLTNNDVPETHPAWSPDGEKITFDADYDGDGYYEIYTVGADGSNLTRLTENQANDQFAEWSPDGTQIAFSSDRNDSWDIFVMNPDGSDQHSLTSDGVWELFPAWSPDGTHIAYNVLAPGSRNTEIFVLALDGSNPVQLTDSPRYDENPVWSPDGTQIAFQTARDGEFELYVMNADGSDQRPIAPNRGNDFWPSWQAGAIATGEQSGISFLQMEETFAKRTTYIVRLGDLDADGDLDAVFAVMGSQNSEVWFNDGHGNFSDSGQQLTNQGHGAALGDLDADGDLDLVIVCQHVSGAGGAHVYFNDGQGFFIESQQDPAELPKNGNATELLDIDLDGDLDWVVKDHYVPDPRPHFIYLNDGYGVFTISELTFPEVTELAWDDLDGDGDPDVFIKEPGVGYRVMLNDGRGSFSDHWQMEDTESSVAHQSVGFGDLDGDGDLDAYVTNGSIDQKASGLVLLNDGSGAFAPIGERLAETGWPAVSLGDLDLDSDLDACVTEMGIANHVLLNDGMGNFTDSGLTFNPRSPSRGCALGDLDGDGDLDLFFANFGMGATHANEVWLNQTIP